MLPIGQTNAQPCTLSSVRRKTVTVTFSRRTFAHILFARFNVIVRIQAAATLFEHFRLQRSTQGRLFLVLAHRRLGQVFMFASARLGTAHLPGVRESPYLIVGKIAATSRYQIITPNIIVIAAQTAKAILKRCGRLNLNEIVTVPQKMDTDARTNGYTVHGILNVELGAESIGQQDAGAIDFDTHFLA